MSGIICAIRGGPASQPTIETIHYTDFMRKGLPALVITVGLATLWLLWRFL